MKIVLGVFADFEQAPLGAACLTDALAGQAILDRTLERCRAVAGIAQYLLVVQERDRAAGEAFVARHEGFVLCPTDSGARPRRRLYRAARKWNLDSWRGGLLGGTWFDEYLEPIEAARVLDATQADAVLCVEGHQAVCDPALLSGAVAAYEERVAEATFIFDQAPPGLSGPVLGRNFVRELVETQSPFGAVLGYHPDSPRMDLITKPMCRRIDSFVSQTQARFLPDTQVGLARLEGALAAGQGDSGEALCAWARTHPLREATLPVEVELELTTADPLPGTRLRPRNITPARTVDPTALQGLATELGQADDRLVWLGGFGDPLQHPQFGEIIQSLRAAGVYGLGLATPLVDLTDATLEALFAAPVDVVEVQLDAHSPETYARLQGGDHFAQVCRNLERLQNTRRERVSPEPIVCASMVRCSENYDEMEAFFDHWIRHLGWAVLHGYSTFDGTLPVDGLPGTTPPIRQRCRRLHSRLMVLADGRILACGEDPGGHQQLGSRGEETLAEIWRGQTRQTLLNAHQEGDWGRLAACGDCQQWHRA